MLPEERKKLLERKKNDPDYIAFKKLKGVLGKINSEDIREVKTNEVITRYQYNS